MKQEPEEHDDNPDIGGNAAKQFATYIERIERLTAERKAIGEDIKSVFAEAASCGVDKKALRQIIKNREADLDKTITLRAVTETYMRALSNLQGELGDWARSWRSNAAKRTFDPVKQDYANPNLDAILKGMRARGKDAASGEGASP
jgi:uncharacterized protein (UPF0335 family)